jgi:hypothetical protein
MAIAMVVGLLLHWALLPNPKADAQVALAVPTGPSPIATVLAVSAPAMSEKYRFMTGEVIGKPND